MNGSIRSEQCGLPTLDQMYPVNPDEMMVGHYVRPSTVSYWEEADTEEKYDRNGGHHRYSKTDIVYSINSFGYRSPEFDTPRDGKYVIAVIGCSNTKGVGLPVYETYCELFTRGVERIIDKPVLTFNLGQGGASNDKIALRAFSAARFLKPDFIVVQWTYSNRLVYVDPMGKVFDWWSLSEEEVRNPGSDQIKRKVKYFEEVQSDWNDSNRFLNIARTTGLSLSRNKPFGYLQHMMFRTSSANQMDRMFDPKYTITKPAIDHHEKARDHSHRGREVNEDVANTLLEHFKTWYRDSKSIA